MKSMTEEEKRVKIAEACGYVWTEESDGLWWRAGWQHLKDWIQPRGKDLTTIRRNRADALPDYLNSRDAIISAVLTRTEEEQREIVRELFNEVNEVAWDMDDLPIVLWSDLLKLFAAPPTLICSAFVAVCGKEGR